MLTPDEISVLRRLDAAYSAFRLLPDTSPADLAEFARALNTAQTIIMARAGRRALASGAGGA